MSLYNYRLVSHRLIPVAGLQNLSRAMQNEAPRMIRKVTCVTTNKGQVSDYHYWITRSFQERLDAIELLRQAYLSMKLDVPQRLQRVYRVTQQKPS